MSNDYPAMVQIGSREWLSFRAPALVLQADAADAVRPTISDVEHLTRDRGLHAVGFVTYEAGSAFGLRAHDPVHGLPLAWFALYEPANVARINGPDRAGDYTVGALSPTIERDAFGRAFERIKEHLAAGDTYQVNYTFGMSGSFDGDAASLFADLAAAQQGAYAAFVDVGDFVICSASPELFFEFRGTDVLARPMKGTARRGRTLDEDRQLAAGLAASTKERAENVMVVDMVRNDLGRIADVGSVEVPELFSVERFPNVWQMTSLVKARSLAPLADVFAALHPSASVTGAPKVRTMELLRELEAGPRGVYTGAVGHVPPDGSARFNVAIRTAVIDRRGGRLSFGIGSGIVWDSDASAEYAECLLKGSVMARPTPQFELLETLRWTPGEGYYLLDRHMQRLADSAEYFGIPARLAEVRSALETAVSGSEEARRVRLLVARDGDISVGYRPHVQGPEPMRVALAPEPIDMTDVFLYHKTTNRAVYERARAARSDVDDVLLWNGDGEITEATTANVVVEIDGVRVTPPIRCGLLAGTCRAAMLASGEIVERHIPVSELDRVSRLWLINSVQGARAAHLVR